MPRTLLQTITTIRPLIHAALVGSLLIYLAGCGGANEAEPVSAAVTDQPAQPSVVHTPPAVPPASGAVAGQAPSPPAAEAVEVASAAETPPPAEITVEDTGRPPATAKEAAELLDLRTFPVLEKANIPSHRLSIGRLYYSAPVEVAKAFEFQREQLRKLGWKELPGSRETGENPAATFTQEGFLVYVSVSSYGQGPNGEQGWTSISLGNHGNVLTGKLPIPEGAKPHYPMLTQASYVTEAPLEETAQACKKLLIEAGWQPYGENINENPVSNSYNLEFKQNAVQLSAHVSDHENQPGKVFITYSTEQLTADIPPPPGDADFRYTDSDKRMHFDTKDSAQDIASHYVEELGKLGWKPTTENLIVDDRDRTAMMVFRNEAKDRIDLDMQEFNEIVRVKLQHYTPAEIAELDRQIEALVEQRKREAAEREVAEMRRRESLTYEVPIPAQAKDYVLGENGNGLEITMPAGSGPAALAALRKHFKQAGWEESNFSNDGPAGTLMVARDDTKLWFHYINIGDDDFELEVTCFGNYVKPVKAKPEEVPE